MTQPHQALLPANISTRTTRSFQYNRPELARTPFEVRTPAGAAQAADGIVNFEVSNGFSFSLMPLIVSSRISQVSDFLGRGFGGERGMFASLVMP